MINKRTTYFNENGFEFNFEPIEDTLEIKKTKEGYEARYLIQDELVDSPDEWQDEGLFLVNYHRDFWVERNNIITEETVKDIYLNYQSEETKQIEKEYHIFPLSMLSHSGVWLSLNYSFVSDAQGWDTSHVGLVLVSKKEARLSKTAYKLAEGLVKTWNTYLTGDVYCLIKETYDKEKNPIDYDTLGGVYELSYALDALKTEI